LEETSPVLGNLAGIQVGDWIVSWEGAGATGLFETPFDLWQVIFEQAPRGRITVYGQRAGEPKVWSLPPSRWWGLETRPVLPGDVLAFYGEAQAAVQAGDVDRGILLAERAAETLFQRGDVRRAAWLDRWAAASAKAKSWQESDRATERGVERLMAHGDFWGAVLLRRWNGLDHQQAGHLEQAQQRYRRALDLARHTLTGSMQEAKILLGLRASASILGDLTEADKDFGEALRATETIAPENLDVAELLADLGDVSLQRGDLTAADRWMRKAHAIQERLAPCSLERAVSLVNLAELAWQRGYLSDAETLNRRALDVYEWNLPGQKDTGRVHGILAKLALSRGNLALAEEHLNRSLELFAGDPAEAYGFSEVLTTLAGIAVQRGELANAHQYLARAVQAREQILALARA
jgi:tetratricopeptide (TPR) repeat protein